MSVCFAVPLPKYNTDYNGNGTWGGNQRRRPPKGPSMRPAITAIIIALLIILPQLKAQYMPQKTSDTSHAEVVIQNVTLSEDKTAITAKYSVANNNTMPILKTELIFTVKDNQGNEIASTTKTISKDIQPGIKFEDTEIIPLNSIPTGGIQTSVHGTCYYLNG